MDINFLVSDREITSDNTNRIPSGGINDIRCKFTFKEGYGWEDVPEITAIFARETKWAFQTKIEPDVYFYIPASCLERPGTCYVSLLGCNTDGTKVAQTVTYALIIEPNGLNRNTHVIYPLDEHDEYDTDAYAQYIATVNDCAVRAEEAAKKLENIVIIGGYTKQEADARFMPKVITSSIVTSDDAPFSLATVINHTTPAIRIYGSQPFLRGNKGTINNPQQFTSINSIYVYYIGNKGKTNYNLNGFGELLQVSARSYDYIDILPNKTVLHKNTFILDLATTEHEWVDDNTLHIDLTNENKIKSSDINSVFCTAGDIVKLVRENSIDLFIPRDTDLTDIKLLYPLDKDYTTTLKTSGLPPVTFTEATVNVMVKINAEDPITVPMYVINVEKDLIKVAELNDIEIDKLKEKINVLTAQTNELKARVKILEDYIINKKETSK